MIGGVAIETGLPAYVLSHLPHKVDRNLRTVVVLGMVSLVDTESWSEVLVARIGEAVGYWGEVDRTRHASLKPIDLVVHTE